MRSVRHGFTTSSNGAAGALLSPPTGTSHRRVMRAAWTLFRTRGSTFSEALKQAWHHEKMRSPLSAVEKLHGKAIDSAYLSGSGSEVASAFPVADYRIIASKSRSILVDLIERLVGILDAIDGDADFEQDLEGDISEIECDGRHLQKRTSVQSDPQGQAAMFRLTN